MKILEPGHIYSLDQLDVHEPCDPVILRFVNREKGTEHPGTQTQEVIRALIDRTQHCDNCLRWEGNDLIIYHLRMALVLHEARALQRKVEKGKLAPEQLQVGPDGHFLLTKDFFASGKARAYMIEKPDNMPEERAFIPPPEG